MKCMVLFSTIEKLTMYIVWHKDDNRTPNAKHYNATEEKHRNPWTMMTNIQKAEQTRWMKKKVPLIFENSTELQRSPRTSIEFFDEKKEYLNGLLWIRSESTLQLLLCKHMDAHGESLSLNECVVKMLSTAFRWIWNVTHVNGKFELTRSNFHISLRISK